MRPVATSKRHVDVTSMDPAVSGCEQRRTKSERWNGTNNGGAVLSVDETERKLSSTTGGDATWFTAGGAIRIAHYDVIDDVITRKL